MQQFIAKQLRENDATLRRWFNLDTGGGLPAATPGFEALLFAPVERMPKSVSLLKEIVKVRRKKLLKRDAAHPKFDPRVAELVP